MAKIFAVSLLAILIHATAANARGGGGDTMPGTNFTDMPSYPAKPNELVKRSSPKHVGWRHSFSRDR